LIQNFILILLGQEWKTLVLDGHSPGEFSSSPNQTHLSNLIKVAHPCSWLTLCQC